MILEWSIVSSVLEEGGVLLGGFAFIGRDLGVQVGDPG